MPHAERSTMHRAVEELSVVHGGYQLGLQLHIVFDVHRHLVVVDVLDHADPAHLIEIHGDNDAAGVSLGNDAHVDTQGPVDNREASQLVDGLVINFHVAHGHEPGPQALQRLCHRRVECWPSLPAQTFNTPAFPLFPPLRYAETQLAPNGLRYRDWVCTFADSEHIEKARLESHVLDITTYHQALTPWRRDSTGATEMVLARSSLPLEQRVMHDRTPPNAGVSRFTAFVRSAKARLLQDIKLLPIRTEALDPIRKEGPEPNPTTNNIDRQNITFYEDEASGQILLVYAPNNAKQLEFISLALLPRPQ